MKYKTIKINLTPNKYLSQESKYLRAKLVSDELVNSDINLEVIHDIENKNDSLALEVYFNKISIGFIQKFNSEFDIDDFCFNTEGKKRKLLLKWENGEFLLSREKSIHITDENWMEKLWQWADDCNFSDEVLPREENELLQLKDLNLTSEFFHAIEKIPPEIGNLVNLLSITIKNGKYSELPSEIGNLVNLTSLSISSVRNLSKLPPEIGLLSNLTELTITGNSRLSKLPSEIFNLTNLTDLDLTENSLEEIPAGIDNLINLRKLNISMNYIEELSPEIGKLKKLTYLSAYDNRFSKIPAEIGNLVNLSELYIFRRYPHDYDMYASVLLKTIPQELGNLKNLKKLSLRGLSLTEFPYWITKLHNLKNLWLSQNNIPEIPKEIAKLENLTELDLHSNDFSELPLELTELSNLIGLDISHCHKLKNVPHELLNANGLTIYGLDKI